MADTFYAELFTDPTEYEEEPLRDRKSQLPNLRRDDEKAEFIRDVIALANTARMFGHPAYLLYGLKDNVDEGTVICGVGDSLSIYGELGTHQAWGEFKKEFGQAVLDYIKPLLNPELKHSQIGGHEVAYLQILPLTPPMVFQVRKSIKNQLRTDNTWLRFGESKREIARKEIEPDDDRYRYAYSQVPYILPHIWQQYFESILNDHNPAENLTEAQNIRGYQDLYTTDGRLLQEVVSRFLGSSETLLVIEGAAGSGKSAFLWRWIMTQAEAQLQAVEQGREREELNPPSTGWVPVYHRLRTEPVRNSYRLETRLLDSINKKSGNGFWSGKRPSQPEELFCKPELQWVICLDGLDEIRSQRQQDIFVETWRGFLETYPRIKVILTTRPDTGVGTLKTFGNIITIAAFDDAQVMLYLQNWTESEDYEEFVKFLRSEDELWELCRTPAYLEAACQRLTGTQFVSLEPTVRSQEALTLTSDSLTDNTVSISMSEIPTAGDEALFLGNPVTDVKEDTSEFLLEESLRPLTMGEILYEMYTYLWQRESGRRAEFRQNETQWWLTTGRLALKMDGVQPSILETQAQRVLGVTALRYILSLGILKRTTRLVCFNTELTKAYFAATWLRDCLQTNDVSQAQRLLAPATTEFQQRVCDLLKPLTVKDIQPLFQGGEL